MSKKEEKDNSTAPNLIKKNIIFKIGARMNWGVSFSMKTMISDQLIDIVTSCNFSTNNSEIKHLRKHESTWIDLVDVNSAGACGANATVAFFF